MEQSIGRANKNCKDADQNNGASPMHSQFIEDLLGGDDDDEGDRDVNISSVNSQTTTVVHTP